MKLNPPAKRQAVSKFHFLIKYCQTKSPIIRFSRVYISIGKHMTDCSGSNFFLEIFLLI